MVKVVAGSVPSQDELTEILSNIEEYPSYYVGGTLCVDLPKQEDLDVLTFNLDETCGFFSGKGQRILLDTKNTKLLFGIYKKHKGETDYYKECFSKSHIRHFIS